jgi:hypothetical protein
MMALYFDLLTSYTEVPEISPVGGGKNWNSRLPPSASCSVPFQPLLAYLSHPKASVTSQNYHAVITTNIHSNVMARQLEGNIGKCNGRGSVIIQGRSGRDRSIALLSVASVELSNGS